jgi:hypothetical protein
MLINGFPFDGSSTTLHNLQRLHALAGNASWLPEFRPVRFPHQERVQKFLFALWNHRVCCFLSGLLVMHCAGIINSYTSATLFVALTDNVVVKMIFQNLKNNLTSSP